MISSRAFTVQHFLGVFPLTVRFPLYRFTRREVSLASELTLAGGQKIARVYKKNFTARVILQPGTTFK